MVVWPSGTNTVHLYDPQDDYTVMRKEFEKLARGRAELEEWFQLAHCDLCDRFTSVPYFLGCEANHTFCARCVVALVKTSRQCPSCLHIFEKPDRLTFAAHAEALISLVEVELPAHEARKLREYCRRQYPKHEFVAELLDAHFGQSAGSKRPN